MWQEIYRGGVDMSARAVKVAVDAMGGDYAPQEIVKGAVEATGEDGAEIILVGPEAAIQRELQKYDASGLPIRVVNASQVIQEGESPVAALQQKPDASVLVAMRLVKEGKADAVVSMGSTGMAMVGAIETFGKLEGIKRPSMGGNFYGLAPNTVLFDMGPNADCKPRDLMSFAVIGCAFARKMLHISNPTVALLSNGSEEGKGNKLVKEAYQVFKQSKFNFIGNVEGNDVPAGKADVIVCDGFTGNILLKFCEGLGDSIVERLKVTLDRRLPKDELDAISGDLFALTHMADVGGGGMIYGVDAVVIVGHGRSKALQVARAIHQARQAVEASLLEEIRSELGKLG